MFFVFRVGNKEGTRFLTFVDAVNGFKHLLTEDDLDKALSMCTSLRGNLRSHFIVLSDDRIPPPKSVNVGRGKRKMEDSNEGQNAERKKGPAHFSRPPPPHGVAGVKLVASSGASSAPSIPGGSGTNLARRLTPSQVAKKAPADAVVAPMEIVSGETTSNEDWASAKSNDDTLEENP